MTNILVTGGAGFIGSALVKRLVSEGHAVRVMDDYSRGVPQRLQELEGKIDMQQGDVRSAEEVDRAVAGMEIVYHLAAVNGTENFYNHPERVLEVAVKGTMHTMDAAIRHGCRRYLLASSSEVYQTPTHVPTTEQERIIVPDVRNPRFSYSGGKIIGELLAMHYLARQGVEAVIFRPHNIYGPDMGNEHVVPQFIARILALKRDHGTNGPLPFPIQGDGSETRAFCFIDDAVDGILRIADKGATGEIYHLGAQEEVTVAELAEHIARVMGVSIELQPTELLSGSTPRRCPDISKLRALGYEPHIPLAEGIRRTCELETLRLVP